MERLLKKAAYFSFFSVPNPTLQNVPVGLMPGMRSIITAVQVNESLHRLDIHQGSSGCALGESLAQVHINWVVTPDGYEPIPDEYPPATVLVPFVSQQFCTLDGELRLVDREGSGFRGFGFGRTFPSGFGGPLRLGAIVDAMEGIGAFRGLSGTAVVNGMVRPPNDLALNIMLRLMDPGGKLATSRHLPQHEFHDQDPATLFLVLLGEVDPDRPVQLDVREDGTIAGSSVTERLRLVNLTCAVTAEAVAKSCLTEGPIVGEVTAQLSFNPFSPSRVSPIATRDGAFTFYDGRGDVVGTIEADMVDGRAFRETVPSFPNPIFRFAGFGPVLGGSGAFAGVSGLMTMNAVVSVFPRTLSNMYILRLDDRDGRLRRAWSYVSAA
jgi:hypothetical protein